MDKNRRSGISSKKPTGDSPPGPSCTHDDETLKAFCASVRVEEISFEHWCQHHSKLDLQYPVTISRAQLQLPIRLMIRLSRSIKQTTGDTQIDKREKIAHELVLEPTDALPEVIVVHGLGDQVDEKIGDLCIIIHVKD